MIPLPLPRLIANITTPCRHSEHCMTLTPSFTALSSTLLPHHRNTTLLFPSSLPSLLYITSSLLSALYLQPSLLTLQEHFAVTLQLLLLFLSYLSNSTLISLLIFFASFTHFSETIHRNALHLLSLSLLTCLSSPHLSLSASLTPHPSGTLHRNTLPLHRALPHLPASLRAPDPAAASPTTQVSREPQCVLYEACWVSSSPGEGPQADQAW
ncbi:hypothetical protein E2C01_037199 [Portunus trituberculatus]|uniref:Uncharacterized protein n=1 Tax=Portunus trituberculatus TaxID=210409 RepID=A0A5B7FEB7_PORTR|nr:hypothetical protein [Portunus trituberculatus]